MPFALIVTIACVAAIMTLAQVVALGTARSRLVFDPGGERAAVFMGEEARR